MKITNKYNLPDPIVEAITNDDYDAGDCDISVTQLISPPQIRNLYLQHDDEIEEDASDRIWALFGQSVHAVLERAERTAISEVRLFAQIKGKILSGKFDRLHMRSGTLTDYKVTSVYAVREPKSEWIAQLNVLRWLAHRNGYANIRELKIAAILRDWNRSGLKRDHNYPICPFITLDIPMWDDDKTVSYIHKQLDDHFGLIARDCTEDETWARPDKYAVMKGANKLALKLFDKQVDAERYIDDYAGKGKKNLWIEYRKGEAVRCKDYCPVSKWCRQYQVELETKS